MTASETKIFKPGEKFQPLQVQLHPKEQKDLAGIEVVISSEALEDDLDPAQLGQEHLSES